MWNERETTAKEKEGFFGEYVFECPDCRTSYKLPFWQFIDHRVTHEFMRNHRAPQKPFGMDGELWRHLEAQRRNPRKPPYLVRPLPPYVVHPLAWAEPSKGRLRKVLPEQKMLLPPIADWLEFALKTLSELDSILESSEFVAEKLLKLVTGFSKEFEEQEAYLLDHQQILKDTGMDPKCKPLLPCPSFS